MFQSRANQPHGSKNGESDSNTNQTVLDRRCGGLVLEKMCQEFRHGGLLRKQVAPCISESITEWALRIAWQKGRNLPKVGSVIE